jgi:hypothetical protein
MNSTGKPKWKLILLGFLRRASPGARSTPTSLWNLLRTASLNFSDRNGFPSSPNRVEASVYLGLLRLRT